jgi:hypothetical protein
LAFPRPSLPIPHGSSANSANSFFSFADPLLPIYGFIARNIPLISSWAGCRGFGWVQPILAGVDN